MKKNIFILCILGGLVMASGVAFTHKKGNDPGAPSTPSQKQKPAPAPLLARAVVVEKATLSRQAASTLYPGSVQACRETRLAFRVGGPLVQMNVKPGDQVKKGDLLMQIDPQDFKDKIEVLEAQLSGARAQQDNAAQDFARMKKLFDQKVIPQADFDHARTARNTARAQVDAVRAQLNIARHQWGYTTLRAPYDAIVTATHIENHEMTAPGQVVVGLHDISHLEIKITVPENEISFHPLVTGTPAKARFPAIGDQKFDVSLKEWNTTADRATRTYGATFTLPRPPGVQILPGMTAEIQWPGTRSRDRHLTIPAKAVVTDSTGTAHVWRFDPATATASRIPVSLGALHGASRIVVKSGLGPEDLIVIDGMDFITAGMKLAPTLAVPPSAAISGEETRQ